MNKNLINSSRIETPFVSEVMLEPSKSIPRKENWKEKIEQKIQSRKARRLKLIFIYSVIGSYLLGLFLLTLLKGVNVFFEKYRLDIKNPIEIKINKPITVIDRFPKPKAKPTAVAEKREKVSGNIEIVESDIEMIKKEKYGDIMLKIYEMESNSGKNDSCRKSGKFNGFGYGQNTDTWMCYNTFEEVVNKVNSWFEAQYKTGYAFNQILCFYNTGTYYTTCDYNTKFNNIKP